MKWLTAVARLALPVAVPVLRIAAEELLLAVLDRLRRGERDVPRPENEQ